MQKSLISWVFHQHLKAASICGSENVKNVTQSTGFRLSVHTGLYPQIITQVCKSYFLSLWLMKHTFICGSETNFPPSHDDQ